jgi:hypothetical protein
MCSFDAEMLGFHISILKSDHVFCKVVMTHCSKKQINQNSFTDNDKLFVLVRIDGMGREQNGLCANFAIFKFLGRVQK